MKRIAGWVCLALLSPSMILAQAAGAGTVTARMVVTMGHHYGHEPPVLTQNDLSVVTPEYEKLAVTSLAPLRGDKAALEIYVLVDNCSSCEAGTKFQELSRFISSQASTTAVGIGYINSGKLSIALAPTLDRELAVKSLSTPAGSKPASPYDALKDLVSQWRKTDARRVVLMVTNGINPSAPPKTEDPSAEAAIAAAQRAGVTVYAIYHPGADYATSDASKIYDGQVQLAHVAHDTGGEAYFMGFGPLPSIAPFLADIADHLSNQYLLEFQAAPAAGSGELKEVTVKCGNNDIELMVPERAWIPAR